MHLLFFSLFSRCLLDPPPAEAAYNNFRYLHLSVTHEDGFAKATICLQDGATDLEVEEPLWVADPRDGDGDGDGDDAK